MGIKLSCEKLTCGKLASEKLRLSTQKIRSTFIAENTLHKLLCKLIYPVAIEDKNNILHEVDSCN